MKKVSSLHELYMKLKKIVEFQLPTRRNRVHYYLIKAYAEEIEPNNFLLRVKKCRVKH